MDVKNIACIVLAAGAGKRFGIPKWKADFKGKSFLEIIIGKLIRIGIDDIGCVVRKDSIPELPRIKYIVNPAPEEGMFSSLFFGINLFPQKKGFIILPVDHPFFEIDTIRKLLMAFDDNSNCIIKPLFDGKGGHPIVLPQDIALSIPKGDFQGGLKKFIEKKRFNVYNVNVNDKGVLRNINFQTDINEH